MERLQKIISARLHISRRAAEELIAGGLVTVDGRTAVLGQKAEPGVSVIAVRGEELRERERKKVYIMLNKPVGYVTTMSDEKGRKSVNMLVEDVPERVYPVGRLDINSEGLLIMTNDGELTNRLTHPSHEKSKTYLVTVRGDLEAGLRRLREPMELDGFTISDKEVILKKAPGTGQLPPDAAVLSITIHEGRNRQIRRMAEAAGLRVTRLTRIAEGGVTLGRLKKGTWRYLTNEEIRRLREENQHG